MRDVVWIQDVDYEKGGQRAIRGLQNVHLLEDVKISWIEPITNEKLLKRAASKECYNENDRENGLVM